MSNEGFFFSLLPFSTPLSVLSVCHICGLCGDVSLLRMDSPAQKRPYYIYILLHHSETQPAGLQSSGQKEREKAKKKGVGGWGGRREWKMGWGLNNVNKKQNKERGTAKDRGMNKEWSNRGRGSKDDKPVAVVEKQNWGKELRRHPEIACDSNIRR